jgi:hypothetical protein
MELLVVEILATMEHLHSLDHQSLLLVEDMVVDMMEVMLHIEVVVLEVLVEVAGPLDLVSGKRGTFSNTGAGAYVPTDIVYGEPLPNPQAAAGLWLGEVSLRAVTEVTGNTTNAATAGGVFDFNIILHADSNGVVRLLKDVTIMQKRNAASNLTEIVLLTDEGLIPNFEGVIKRAGRLVGMRYSSAFSQFESAFL